METTVVPDVLPEFATHLPDTSEELFQNDTLRDAVVNGTLPVNQPWPELPLKVFEVFIIIEIVMIIVELLLSFGIAVKMKKWRRNYRNQMLTQISLARFIKRIIGYVMFLEKRNPSREERQCLVNLSLISYINLVTIFLIIFLIKHMYDTLIVVLVKIRKNNLYKVSLFSWLFPIPLTCVWVAGISFSGLQEWLVDFIFCLLFKWTPTFIGTILYISVLNKILQDKFRQFAMNLAIITFMLCLTIIIHMVSSDVARLFRCFLLSMIKYIMGFILNCLVLCLYIALISPNFVHRVKSGDALPEHSESPRALNGDVSENIERYSIKNDTRFERHDLK